MVDGLVLNTLSIDEGAQISAIKEHYFYAMVEAEEQLIELMKREIQKTIRGNSPGKPEWRNEISGQLKEVYLDITDNYIKLGVGIPDTAKLSTIVKAMLIGYGSGSMADGGGEPIKAGPPGRPVWDDDLESKKPSGAKSTYLLPLGFNQAGNHFILNAIAQMKTHFDNVLADASKSLPQKVFYGNVKVTKGAKG